MTHAQELVVNMIRGEVEKLHGEYSHKYEIKQWEVKPLEETEIISVYFEVGLIGDEGTLAEVFARDSGHMFVGKRGGITYYTYKNKNTVKKTLKRYGRSLNLYTVICDQRTSL